MPSNVQISITADQTDLQAKLALAQSNLRGFSAETKAAADAVRDAGSAATNEMKAGLDQAASSMAAARAEAARLRSQLGETGTAFAGLRERIVNGSVSLRASASAFTELGEAIGLAFVGERAAEALKSTAEMGEKLLALSKETGISTETLSGWHYAAEQMGVSAESLDTGMMRLGRNIQTALITPTSQAAAAFRAAGASQDFLRANSNNFEAVLRKLADAFHDHADGAQADAIAMAIFGRAGAELIPLLREGGAGMDELLAKARALGVEISGPPAEAMDKYSRQVKDLDASWRGVWYTVANFILPALTQVAKLMMPIAAPIINPATGQVEPASQPGLGQKQSEEDIAAKGGAYATIPPMPGSESGASGAAAKTPFGDLTTPITAMEAFRAKLEDVKVAMQQQGASAEAILMREAEMWRREASAAGLSAQQKIQAQSEVSRAWSALLTKQGEDAKAEADRETRDATSAYRQQMEMIKNSNEEALAAIRAAHSGSKTEELQAEAAYWRQIIAMTRQGTQQQIEATKQLGLVTKQTNQQEAQDAQQTFNKIAQPFNSFVRAVISGHQTMGQAAKQMWTGYAQTVVENLAKASLQELAHFATGKAIDEAQTASKAKLVFSEVYADVAAIPYVGWILAPPAAAAAAAAVMAFDVGTPNVPSTMAAQIHQGEGIVPATFMDSIRSGQLTLGGPASGAVAGPSATIPVTIMATNPQQMIAALRDPTTMRAFAAALSRYTNNNPSQG